jgi:signal transduction histidine kinase
MADAAMHDKAHLYISQLAYSNYLLTIHQPDSALLYAGKVHERLLTSPELFIASDLYPLLAKIYESKKQFELAYKYQGESIKANDSIFSSKQAQQVANITFNEHQHEIDLKNAAIAYDNKLKLYGVLLVLIITIIISTILWRANKKELAIIALLRKQQEELKQTQTQLIQSEKMASLGELTAGIAHEIQNPLNFVNNFSEVNREMIDELKAELKSGNVDEALAIADDIGQNEEKINHHGKRADSIVKGMLEHSRSSSGQKELTDLNVIADEYLRLSYHGLRSKDKSFNAEIISNLDPDLPKINVIPQDIGRVLLNLFNNAFYAVNQKAKTAGADYKPTVSVETFFLPLQGVGGLKVKDNGTGIPDAIKEKIMQPFFTTKPTGEGTGLGLSLTYDMVVKGHGGSIAVASKDSEGSEFTISLPIN